MKTLSNLIKPKILCAAMAALLTATSAYAGSTCELIDADPNTEDAGASTADGVLAVSCGIGNHANSVNSVALGFRSISVGQRSAAIGFRAITSGLGSVAVGSWIDRDNNTAILLDVDLDNDGAFDTSRELTTAIGDHSAAIGAGAWAVGQRSASLGAEASAEANDSVAIGSHSLADRENTVSVGASGTERQITNVAAGTQATDAVNLSQLQATLATANAYTDTAVATGGTQANAYTDNRETAIRQDMQAGDAQTLSAAKDYTDKKFADLDFSGINDRFDAIDRRVGHLDDRLNRVGALGAAMVGMASSAAAVEGGRTRIGIAAGAYGGKQALSVGLQQRINSRAALTIGGAFSGSEHSATIGVGFGL